MTATSDSSGAGSRAPAGGIAAPERRLLEAVDDEELLQLLRELIALPSENPPGNEAACARFLSAFLDRRGVACRLAEIVPGRPNLYARVGSSDPTLVLCGHLDTVPAGDGWTVDPFAGVVSGGEIYGRGACDMKSGLASMAAVLLAVKRSGLTLSGSVALHAVIDEEERSMGAKRAQTERRGDWVIVTEPTGGRVFSTGNGQLNFDLVFYGKAVHSSHPEDGRNAIHDAAAFISLLEEHGRRLASTPYAGIGPATYSVGLVNGGRGGSTVADRCELTVDRRVLPSETLDSAEAELRLLLGHLETARPGLRWHLSRTVAFPPLRPGNPALEQVLRQAITDLGGATDEEPRGMRFATDAAWYATNGCSAVVFGPGDVAIAHQPDERVAIEDVTFATRVLALTCVRLLT